MYCYLDRALLRPASCQICHEITKTIRSHIGAPNILHLQFCKGELELPLYCDKEIELEGIFYDIVGAIYGNGTHFIARHLHDGKIFESDGYRKHLSSAKGSRTVMEALDVEIKEPYEKAMACHINWTLLHNTKVYGSKISDVYYIRR